MIVIDRRRSRRACAASTAAAARSSPSARSTACTSATRRCCASCAISPTRAASTACAHLRPAPGRGRAARVGAEAAHDARPEARAARSDRRPRRVPRAALRRGAQQGAGRGLRARGARRAAPRAARGRRRRLPLRLPPPRRRAAAQRMGAELGFEVLGLGLVARRSDGRRPIYSSTAHPRAARRRRRRGAAALLGRPHEVRGAVVERRPAGPRARLPDRQRRGARALCLPADGVYAGTYVGADGVERRRDLARAPARRSTRSRAVAARGVRARLRRRPLRRRPHGPLPWHGSGARSASTPSRPGRADASCDVDGDPPAPRPERTGGSPPRSWRSGTRPVTSVTSRLSRARKFYSAHARQAATITENRLHDTDTGSPRCRLRC